MIRRVLVTDDSAVFRTLLRRVLSADPLLHVIGEASNGDEAIELAERLKPDVITMDIHMPVTDGLDAIRQIMESNPRPIVVVTGTVDPREVKEAFDALEAGAVAAVRKPPAPNHPDFEEVVREIVTTVRLMSEVKVVRRRRGARQKTVPVAVPRSRVSGQIVAIGASTGGPAALETILRRLPADFPAPLLVVQHIAPGFEQGLVDWLQSASPLRVRLASPYQPVRAGEVVVARHGKHLTVSRDAAMLDGTTPMDGHCPSASALFSSVASSWGAKAVGVVLTGMGGDGARGLVELKQAGGWVIAQDEATSVVHGMAAAAAKAGAVDQVLPLEAIPAAIMQICRVRRGS